MAKQMAFNIFGVGISGFSSGEAWLAFTGGILYRAYVQGSSGSTVYSPTPFNVSNDLNNGRGDITLVNFSRAIVHIAIPQNFISSAFASFTFEIFDGPSATGPAYKFERPNMPVSGVSTGSIDFRAQFQLVPRSSTADIVWSRVWAGRAMVSAALGRG